MTFCSSHISYMIVKLFNCLSVYFESRRYNVLTACTCKSTCPCFNPARKTVNNVYNIQKREYLCVILISHIHNTMQKRINVCILKSNTDAIIFSSWHDCNLNCLLFLRRIDGRSSQVQRASAPQLNLNKQNSTCFTLLLTTSMCIFMYDVI